MVKRCPRCGQELPVADFAPHRSRGLQSWCRKCYSSYRADLKAAGKCAGHPDVDAVPGQTRCAACVEAKAWADLWRRYRVTPSEWRLRLERQGWKCAVPGCEGKPTCLDHDHDYEATDPAGHRGILCDDHNKCEGFARGRPAFLRGLAMYLESHHAASNGEG